MLEALSDRLERNLLAGVLHVIEALVDVVEVLVDLGGSVLEVLLPLVLLVLRRQVLGVQGDVVFRQRLQTLLRVADDLVELLLEGILLRLVALAALGRWLVQLLASAPRLGVGELPAVLVGWELAVGQ